SPGPVSLTQSAGPGSVAAAAPAGLPAGNDPLGLAAADSNGDGAPHPANAGSSSTPVGVALNQDLGPFGPAAPAGPGLAGAGAPRAAAANSDPGGPTLTDAVFSLVPDGGTPAAVGTARLTATPSSLP